MTPKYAATSCSHRDSGMYPARVSPLKWSRLPLTRLPGSPPARVCMLSSIGCVPNTGDTLRRSALRIFLWARHPVHERWRYGRAAARPACSDHRQGRGRVEFRPHRRCGRGDRGGAPMRTGCVQYCGRSTEPAARMAARICARVRSSGTASGHGAAGARPHPAPIPSITRPGFEVHRMRKPNVS